MKSKFTPAFYYDGVAVFCALIDPRDVVVEEESSRAEHPKDNYSNYNADDPWFRVVVKPSEELKSRLEELGVLERLRQNQYGQIMPEVQEYFDHRVSVSFYRMRNFERKCAKIDQANKELDEWIASEDRTEFVKNAKEVFAGKLENRIRGIVKRNATKVAVQIIKDVELNTPKTNDLKAEYDAANKALNEAQEKMIEARSAWRTARYNDRMTKLDKDDVDPNVKSVLAHSINEENRRY